MGGETLCFDPTINGIFIYAEMGCHILDVHPTLFSAHRHPPAALTGKSKREPKKVYENRFESQEENAQSGMKSEGW
jgi:hypothetical protein